MSHGDSEINDASESETWPDSDCSDDVREFWDITIDGRIDRIGRAPSPQRYSSATTSSIEALDEEEQVVEDTMDVIRHRCAMEEQALQGALEALREHLECEEHVTARSIAAIHRHRNLLVPVMRLPPEILSRIFVFHAQVEESWLDGALTSTHVCKRWREIGRACPELWSHINCEDCRSAAWMARMIRRSGVVPLSLVIGKQARMGTQKMALVVNNMDRSYLSIYMFRLEEATETFSIFAFPPEFLGRSAPNLRHMKLSTSSHIPWDSGLLTRLVTLDVKGSEEPGDVIPPPLEMLLSALAGMPELETLILRHCFHRLSPSETAAHTHVYLSGLKRLEVAAPLARCTRFLRQITINIGAIVLLDLKCSNISKEDVEDFFTIFPSHLYMTLTPVAQALKFTWWEYRDFKIDMWTVQQDTKVKKSQNTSIRLNFYWDSDSSRGISPLDLTWTCFTALASSQLRSFRISSEYLAGWDVGVWRNVARMVPGLRTLAPGKRPQSVALCKALSTDWPDSMPVDCYLPALSYLEIDAPCYHPIPTPDGGESPLAEVLARALAARASAGCSTPLLKLIPCWRGYPGSGWLKLIRDAVPGICVRVEPREEEEFMG